MKEVLRHPFPARRELSNLNATGLAQRRQGARHDIPGDGSGRGDPPLRSLSLVAAGGRRQPRYGMRNPT